MLKRGLPLPVLAALLLVPVHVRAIGNAPWTTPIAPFRIADNLFYVGTQDLASFLVTTPQGGILINSSLQSSPALIQKSVEQLGFHMHDIRILLISHAHWDHDAGSAEILRVTGAKYMVMDADVPYVESGGRRDPAYPDQPYPPAHVDHVLHDGDPVTLGGVTLIAHKTAGHTPGCTTWTMRATSGGTQRDVVIVGGWNVNSEFRLVDHPGYPATYPGIAADFERSFETFKALPCDIFLGAHGAYFDMLAKLQRAQSGQGESVWFDPEGYRAAVQDRERAFRAALAKQRGYAAR